ncbi:MAG: DNA alkylation repair protein [Bacteroidaceae bacterium]|nr:DNA alkylation repair protein [Bacteroidaceae bacterium]
MEENILNEVREIKKAFRLSMNGVVSTLQRRQGLDYKINFGVEIPRLKSIADRYEKNEELATTLWQDNIRECKMLAIFLMPEEGYNTVAEKWIGETRFTEIADQLAMHMLSRMPNALEKALQWTRCDEGLFRYCGYMTISHMLRRGTELDREQEAALFDSLTCLPAEREHSVTIKCAHNAAICYLDRVPDAVARLQKAMDEKEVKETGLKAILETFEECI